ncbi:MAG: YdcF family protein [Deltaproteobacteria bacterium]|nr:YdcF family protein [Deltaproteobacteria bacterium]
MLAVRIALGLLATLSLTGTYTAVAELARSDRTLAATLSLVVPWPLAVLGWVAVVARDRGTDSRYVGRVALALGVAQIASNVALDAWFPYENRYSTPWWHVVALVPFALVPAWASRIEGSRAWRVVLGLARGVAAASTLALVTQLAGVAWVLGASNRDETRRADVAIVLGYGLDERLRARPPLVARTLHGVALHRRRVVRRIIVSGGGNAEVTEADVMRALALREGVPDADIVVERRASSTDENLRFSRALMERHGMRTALVVSEPYHLPRAMRIAAREGIDAHPSPSSPGWPGARHQSFWIVREARLVLASFFR